MSPKIGKIDLDNYLHQNWLLNDASVIDVYKLSINEKELVLRDKKYDKNQDTLQVGGYTFVNNETGILLFKTNDFELLKVVGIKPTTPYFQFEMNGDAFVKNRFQYLENSSLLQSLKLDYTDESIRILERHIHENGYSKIALEKQFLALLAFCGEYLCDKLSGNWYIHYADESNPSWYPYIKANGIYYDVFSNFHEGLFEGIDIPPIIILQESNLASLKQKKLFNIELLPEAVQNIDFKELGLIELEELKKQNVDIELIQEIPENNNFALYKISNGQFLMSDQAFTKGMLFNSKEDYDKFYASIKE